MSVKNQKFDQKRLSSNLRKNRQSVGNIIQSFDHLICCHNSIKFNKLLANNLHISCLCETTCQNSNNFNLSKQTHNDPQAKFQNNNLQQENFYIQISDGKIHVTKNNVKHIFPLQQQKQKYEEKQYIMIEVPSKMNFVINGYGLMNSNGRKIMIVSEQNQFCIPQEKCEIFRPLDLIQQTIRLRTKMLTASVNSSKLAFAKSDPMLHKSQSKSKQLNINWNGKSPKNNKVTNNGKSLSSSIGYNKFSDIQLKGSIRKTNISLAFCDKAQQPSKRKIVSNNRSTFDIEVKGVEYKRSISKTEKNSRSTSKTFQQQQKFTKNPSQKKINNLKTNASKRTKLKEEQARKQNQSAWITINKKNETKKNPSKNKIDHFQPMVSSIHHRKNRNRNLTQKQKILCSPIHKKQYDYDDQISSLSFYTAEKQIPDFQDNQGQDKLKQKQISSNKYENNSLQKSKDQQKQQNNVNILTNGKFKNKQIQLKKQSGAINYYSKNTKSGKKENNLNQQIRKNNKNKNVVQSQPQHSFSNSSNIAKSFCKNISQAKIAQVSRTLLDKNRL